MFLIVKRTLALLILPLLLAVDLHAAYFSCQPYRIVQPDKNVVECFVSGDEYFNWIHDRNGYTLIQAVDGYYYYAVKSSGNILPSSFVAGKVNPAEVGLVPWVKISDQDYLQRQTKSLSGSGLSVTAASSGTLNNLVVYIRFADDQEFTSTRQYFDDQFNQLTGPSLKSYFSEVSYNHLNISSTHYPACALTTNLSYQNFHPRAYYEPFNGTTNPIGYSNDGERISREHTLLKNAIEWVSINSPVPSGLNIDGDNDGNIDNVNFIIRGSCSAWSQLLWAHTWQLFSYNMMLNGKRVWEYTFEPESQSDVKTLCHEMFHSLGAPDLYHYNNDGVQPVGNWDIMETGAGHMGAWMKYRYSKRSWISDIPEIMSSGTYTLSPLSYPGNNCYRIASPNSTNEFFIVEYRKAEGLYEGSLPGSGIIVYRIDTLANGNTIGPPDEVYIYRPNGTRSSNGSPTNAFFTAETGRTSINDATNPGCFLQNGEAGGLQIYDIGTAGSSISFSVYINEIVPPSGLTATSTGPKEIRLQWQKNPENDNVLVVYNTSDHFGAPVNGALFGVGTALPGGGEVIYNGSAQEFVHSGLNNNTGYFYRVFSVTSGYAYSNARECNATTLCGSYLLPFTENFNSSGIPDCWSVQHSGTGTIDNWDISVSNNAGGTGNELRSTFQQASPGTTRIVTPMINTIGMASLTLSFQSTLDDWTPGATLHVQSSVDGLNWTDEAWALTTSSNATIGPVKINTSILHNLNSSHTYLAFSITGNLYSYDFWYIDDISLKCGTVLPVQLNASASPPEGGSVSGGGTYFFGETVTLMATPNQGWEFLNWTENGEIVSDNASFILTAASRNLVAIFSSTEANVVLNSSPVSGGITQGGGLYLLGITATVHALPNTGYEFSGWNRDGNLLTASSAYSFIVNGSVHLVAQFNPVEVEWYHVTVDANRIDGGTLSGGGTFNKGEICTVYSSPYAGWIFEGWKENNEIVSYTPIYSFEVTSDHNLVAVFRQEVKVVTDAFPPEGGLTSGGGSFFTGDTITCRAICNRGWNFSKWTMNGVELSSDSVYSFIATSDCSLKAMFASGVGNPEEDAMEISIYPNPSIGLVHISNPGNEILKEIKIYSSSGKLVSGYKVTSQDNPTIVDLSSLLPGLYIASMITLSGTEARRKLLIVNR
jgi:M6 family metalloprotease-like protein